MLDQLFSFTISSLKEVTDCATLVHRDVQVCSLEKFVERDAHRAIAPFPLCLIIHPPSGRCVHRGLCEKRTRSGLCCDDHKCCIPEEPYIHDNPCGWCT